MKGMELGKAYFEQCGLPMLREEFPQLLPFLSAGLMGSGSECFGFDDEISQDHDFEPGFCLFLPDETLIDSAAAFQLERAYARLPREFEGYQRGLLAPVGGARHGVIRWADFLMEKTGTPQGELSMQQWLRIPQYALAEAVNGEVFWDPSGQVTKTRERLKKMPEEIRQKRLAAHLLLMAQSGQYNYPRILKHGETAAAQLAVGEFVRHTLSAAFLLNQIYEPYYKWSFRAMRKLPRLSMLAETMEYLLTTGNDSEYTGTKMELIEDACGDLALELQKQKLTDLDTTDLERQAYRINDRIRDAELRNLHILAEISE